MSLGILSSETPVYAEKCRAFTLEMVKIDDGFYQITAFTSPPPSGVLGDGQRIGFHFEKVPEKPELRWEGVPDIGRKHSPTTALAIPPRSVDCCGAEPLGKHSFGPFREDLAAVDADLPQYVIAVHPGLFDGPPVTRSHIVA